MDSKSIMKIQNKYSKMALEKILHSFLQKMVTRIKGNSTRAGQVASGSTLADMEEKVNVFEKNFVSGVILVPRHFEVLEKGRGPRKSNKSSNLSQKIEDWLATKSIVPDQGTRKQLARFMTLRMNKFGSKLFQSDGRTDIFTNVLNESDPVTDVISKAEGDLIANITKNLIDRS